MDVEETCSISESSPYISEFFAKKNKTATNSLLRNFKKIYDYEKKCSSSPIRRQSLKTKHKLKKDPNGKEVRNMCMGNIRKTRKKVLNTDRPSRESNESELQKYDLCKTIRVKSKDKLKSQKLKPDIFCTPNKSDLIYFTEGRHVVDVNKTYKKSSNGTKLAYVETCVPRIDVTDYGTDSKISHRTSIVNKVLCTIDISDQLDNKTTTVGETEPYFILNSNESETEKRSINDDSERCTNFFLLSHRGCDSLQRDCKFRENKLLASNTNETYDIETQSRFFQSDPCRVSKSFTNTSSIRFHGKHLNNYISGVDRLYQELNTKNCVLKNVSVDCEEFELFFSSVIQKVSVDICVEMKQKSDESEYENRCFKLRNTVSNIDCNKENIACESVISNHFNNNMNIHSDNKFQPCLIYNILKELNENVRKITTDSSTFDSFYVKNEKSVRKQIESNCFNVASCSIFNSCHGSYYIENLSDNVNIYLKLDNNLDKIIHEENIQQQSISKYFNNSKGKFKLCKPNIFYKKQPSIQFKNLSREQSVDNPVKNNIFHVDTVKKNILSQFSFQTTKSKLIINKNYSTSVTDTSVQNVNIKENSNNCPMEITQINQPEKYNMLENKKEMFMNQSFSSKSHSSCNEAGKLSQKHLKEKKNKLSSLKSSSTESRNETSTPLESLILNETKVIYNNKEIVENNSLLTNSEHTLPIMTYSNSTENSKECINNLEKHSQPSQSIIMSSIQDRLSSLNKDIDSNIHKRLNNSQLEKSQSKTTKSPVKNKFTFSQKKEIKKFKPPISPFGLIEEEYTKNPWALLVATIFLTKTSGKKAKPIIDRFLEDNPDPESVIAKEPHDFEHYFVNLGLKKRSELIWKMSVDYIRSPWINAKDLRGIGKYGDDAYRMFILGDTTVQPTDKYLKKYLDWWLENLDDS